MAVALSARMEIRHVGWSLGNYCNARCNHCYSWKVRQSPRVLEERDVDRILEQLIAAGVKTVNLGGNEPLFTNGPEPEKSLLPYIVERARAAGMTIGVTTNDTTALWMARHRPDAFDRRPSRRDVSVACAGAPILRAPRAAERSDRRRRVDPRVAVGARERRRSLRHDVASNPFDHRRRASAGVAVRVPSRSQGRRPAHAVERSCRGGCAARALLVNGSLDSRDPYCPDDATLVELAQAMPPQELRISPDRIRVHEKYLCTVITGVPT